MADPRARRVGRRSRWRLVFLGDLAVDVVIHPEGSLVRGSDVPGSVRFRAGGSAANAARWAARLGARVTFVGALGRDPWGRRLAAALRAERVTPRLARVPGQSARIAVLLTPGGERSFVADRGAADQLSPAVLRASWFAADLLHLPAYSLLSDALLPAALRAVELARPSGALVSLDLASRGPLLSHGRREVLRRIARVAPDVLFGNEFEVGVLAAARGPQALLELAPVLCVKRGAAGSAVWARQGERAGEPLTLEVLAAPVRTSDTTGAGDAFDAGFLIAWLDGRAAGMALPAALRRAALAGNRAAARQLRAPRRELLP